MSYTLTNTVMRYINDTKNCIEILNVNHGSKSYWCWVQITIYKIRQWLDTV
jgi:hypothetical protein